MSKKNKLILCLIIPIIGFVFYIKEHYLDANYGLADEERVGNGRFFAL